MIDVTTTSEEQTVELAARLATGLIVGDVVTLAGELGSGKTCFVRGLAVGLGIDPAQVSSPTFVLCQEYEESDTPTLAHIDAYRLHGPDELESIGWDALLADDRTIIAVEWPDRIAESLSFECIAVRLDHAGDTTRRIEIDGPQRVIELFTRTGDASRACRTCGEIVPADGAAFPFCSDRCRLADLGQWFAEGFVVGRPIDYDEEI